MDWFSISTNLCKTIFSSSLQFLTSFLRLKMILLDLNKKNENKKQPIERTVYLFEKKHKDCEVGVEVLCVERSMDL